MHGVFRVEDSMIFVFIFTILVASSVTTLDAVGRSAEETLADETNHVIRIEVDDWI
jgi:hypothetical protein